jgi:hypothetical protein
MLFFASFRRYAFHDIADDHSPKHESNQQWDGLIHALLHPGETRAHAAGETLKVWTDLPDDEKQALELISTVIWEMLSKPHSTLAINEIDSAVGYRVFFGGDWMRL